MIHSVHIPYKSSIIATIENINSYTEAKNLHVEFDELETLPPLGRDLTFIKMDEIEISEEYHIFFNAIIRDFEQSLSESFEWMRSRTAAA
ncbi:hypothetical protein JNM05_11735 [bacterium]|nr:hypothetical protein [bacterium]